MRKSIRFVRFGHILAGGAALALMVAACSPAAATPTTSLATAFPTSSLSTEATAVGTSAISTEATSVGTSAVSTESTAVGTRAVGTESTAVGTQAVTPNSTSVGTQTANGTQTVNNAPLLIESDKLLGMTVMDNTGASAGSIVDVLVNTTGTVQAVVLNLSAAGTPSANATALSTEAATAVSTAAATSAATTAPTSAATSKATTAATAAATSAATTAAGTPVPAGTQAVSTQTAGNFVAVPWTDIMADPTTQQLTYKGGMSSLNAMTPFDENAVSSGYVIRSESSGVPSNYNGLIRLGGDLKDLDVQTPANDKLGDVQHVIIDMQSGMANYAVVDFGGFLGIGTESVLVPWNKFQLDNTDKTTTKPIMRLNVTKDSLQSAPKFDEKSLSFWPTPANQGWDSQIQLFWQTAAS